MSVKSNFDTAPVRTVDANLKIHELIADPTLSFDLAGATLNGDHPTVVNAVSDRAYFILSGSGIVRVGSKEFSVREGDSIRIDRGTPHTISGKLQYLIVTSPPFSPQNESIIE